MKTLYIVPAALLAAAVVLGSPSASASVSEETIQMTFAYNQANTAEQIYADLHKAAAEACVREIRASLLLVGPSLGMKRQLRACMNNVVEAGIAAIARSDVAALHEGMARHRRA